MPKSCLALGTKNPDGEIVKMTINRRDVGPKDVEIDVSFCGICHSDLHQIRSEWGGNAFFPMVPGHEIVGVVSKIGDDVKKFQVGDKVGVGCMVDSCRTCQSCKIGREQHCGRTDWTYNDQGPKVTETKENLHGGYSQRMVVNQDFVLSVPDALADNLAEVAPLLCAGITMYSPLISQANIQAGQKIGIVGFGGLGWMGAKIAKAAGCDVTIISRGTSKKAKAEEMGCSFIDSKDSKQMDAAAGDFDSLVSTIPASYDPSPYVNLLQTGGCLYIVGLPPNAISVEFGGLIFKNAAIRGSLIGGIQETQDMLDFCAKHDISYSDITAIAASEVNDALNKLSQSSSATSRYVIKIQDTLNDHTEVKPFPEEDLLKRYPVHPNANVTGAEGDYKSKHLSKESSSSSYSSNSWCCSVTSLGIHTVMFSLAAYGAYALAKTFKNRK